MEYLYSNHLIVPKIENPFDFDWLYHEQQQQQRYENLQLDLPPLGPISEPNLPPLLPQYHYDHDQLPRIDFQDFEDFGGVFSFDFDDVFPCPKCEDAMVVDEKPQHDLVTSFHHYNQHHVVNMNMTNPISTDNKCSSEVPRMSMIENEVSASTKCGEVTIYKKSAELELDDIQKYFDLPIKEAAKELHVGVTRLKKRCRELNITRWPHRKLKSLKYLINNVKNMGLDLNEIRMLEEHQKLLEEVPNMELTQKTKKLRQACFKANYKRKRSISQV